MTPDSNNRCGLFLAGEVLKIAYLEAREMKTWENGKEKLQMMKGIELVIDASPEEGNKLVTASAWYPNEIKHPVIERMSFVVLRVNRLKIGYEKDTRTGVTKVTDFNITDLTIVNKPSDSKKAGSASL